MKKNMRILVVSAVMMLGTTTVQAQFGNLVGNLKKVKETVEDVNKKRNGDIEFTRGGTVQGFFRTRTGEFILDKTHPDGERKGKKVIFKVEKNGDVMYDDGRKVGEVLKDGTVNFHGEQGYLKVQGDGSVMMDGEKVAMINDNGQVYIYDVLIGTAKGLDKKYAALLYLGIYHNKESLAKTKLELAEVKKQREAEAKRQQEQAAQRRAQAAKNPTKSSGNQNNKNQCCDSLNSRGLGDDPKKSRKLIFVPIIIIPITSIISSIFYMSSATPGISHVVIVDIVVVFIILIVVVVLIIPAGIDIFYIPVVLITLVEIIFLIFVGIISFVRIIALI
jgi:hypothetical protein